MQKKIKIMKIYKTKLCNYPFPKSEQTFKSIGIMRGLQSDFKFADAFMLILERD